MVAAWATSGVLSTWHAAVQAKKNRPSKAAVALDAGALREEKLRKKAESKQRKGEATLVFLVRAAS